MAMKQNNNLNPITNLVHDKTARIYINPKFNVSTTTGTSISILQQKQNVHINPLFRNVESIKANIKKTTIHVNPNFVPIKSQTATEQNKKTSTHILSDVVQADKSKLTTLEKTDDKKLNTIINKSRYKLTRKNETRNPPANQLVQTKLTSTPMHCDVVQADFTSNTLRKPNDNKLNTTLNKSRYKLTRNTETRSPIANLLVQNTVRVNKYKLQRLSTIQKYINTSNIHRPVLSFKYSKLDNKLKQLRQTHRKMSNNAVNSKYAVKHIDSRKQTVKALPSPKIFLDKTIKNKRVYSKNSIPCPLFRKYGKCIRYEKGNCLYVHDKKHVSICRKFLKGMCRDPDCLHSHEITLKKMPLCYFYSKGACTKPDCPYLHVKLNDKAKICINFQKGYCEMGDNCLQRHTDSSIKKALKKTHKSKKEIKERKKSDKAKPLLEIESVEEQSTQPSQNKCVQDRYYNDLVEIDPNYKDNHNVIKPSRCKLGDLPSFIHL